MKEADSNTRILDDLKSKVKAKFFGEGTGHDWYHIERVYNNALHLSTLEGANSLICGIAALLHDIDDWKFSGSIDSNVLVAGEWLEEYSICNADRQHILNIVDEVTFKGAGVDTPVSSIESACVQDADRLDAIGAIGIARAFAYGGNRNRLLYDPQEEITLHDSFDEYRKNKGSTVAHFYEKLLLLKDRMKTSTGKKMAEERHAYMEEFLKQFIAEWGESDSNQKYL